MVQGGEIPYQDSALEKRRENAEQWLTADPEIKCFLPGVPRVMYMPFPFQIVQTPEFILVASEYIGATRSIHMTAVELPPIDTYMGHSVGRWEGDKLVIETTNFNAKQDGGPVLPSRRPLAFFLGSGETLRRVETYERLGPDQIAYGVTTDDPSVYVEPYTVLRPMILDNDFLMLQSGCHEGNYGMPYILGAARADEDYAMRAALEAAERRHGADGHARLGRGRLLPPRDRPHVDDQAGTRPARHALGHRAPAGAPRQNEMVAVMEIVRGAPSQAAFSVMADR